MARGLVATCLALVASGPLAAPPLYKLVDREGRVTYTDSPPKVFEGRVTRLELETAPTAQALRAPVAPAGAASAPALPAAAPEGFSERRRRTQADLLTRLEKARGDLADARRAKAAGEAVKPDEVQVIQRRYPVPRAGQPAPFSNCARRVDPASGAVVLVCPTQVPGPAYHARQRELDGAVAEAEAALAAAENGYRRGLD